MSPLEVTILEAIRKLIQDSLDEGREPFGSGADYDTVTIDWQDDELVIDGIGAGKPALILKTEVF